MTEASTETTRQQALNAAAGAAAKRLKDAHLDEYNTYYAEEAEKRGQKWEPRLTPEQRAQRDLERILAEHPHLAPKVQIASLAEGVEEIPATG